MIESIHEDKRAMITMVRLNLYNKTLCHDLSCPLHTMEDCLTVLGRVTPASFGGRIEQRDSVFRRKQPHFVEGQGVKRRP
jgi:hypothetical protein